jgi:putative ABC transport system ATP-binding protein
MNILGGLDLPSSGCVRLNGTDICALSEDALARFRRETIGYIFQQSHLIPYLSATENVMLCQYFHSIPDEDEAREALRRVGLGHRLDHKPSQLSGGEQQRVCIARALINSPKLLLADEPTGNLDRENTRVVLELLKRMFDEEHFTIVLVTHDPFVAEWAGRVVGMEDGHIVLDRKTGRGSI